MNSMKDLFDSVEDILNDAITASIGDLNDIQKIHVGGGFPPMAEFPLLTIGADRIRKEHKRATGNTALDSSFGVQYDWFIAVVTSTDNLRTSFEQADGIFKELITIIDENYTWGGIVHDTNYSGDIEFGSPSFGDTSKLTYVIMIPLTSNFRWGRAT